MKKIEIKTSNPSRVNSTILVGNKEVSFDENCVALVDEGDVAELVAIDPSLSTENTEVDVVVAENKEQFDEVVSKLNEELVSTKKELASAKEELSLKAVALDEANKTIAKLKELVATNNLETETTDETSDIEENSGVNEDDYADAEKEAVKVELMKKTVADLKANCVEFGFPESEYSKLTKEALVDYMVSKI